MIADARELLRRKLSTKAFQNVDLCWWIGRHYLPRLGASLFVRRSPKVQGFPGGQAELVDQLHGINLIAVTKYCHTMLRNGSDKGWGLHNYTIVYSALFSKLRNQSIRIFELGLGSNNPNIPFYMGASARPGASLRAWRELFPQALVYGADIDRDILFAEDRIQTFYCDQLDANAVRDLWTQPALAGGMDIIIDDGHHTYEANMTFLEGSLRHLRPGGTFVVEDIQRETFEQWRNQLEEVLPHRFPNHQFALVELPHPLNNADNNLLIIQRHA